MGTLLKQVHVILVGRGGHVAIASIDMLLYLQNKMVKHLCSIFFFSFPLFWIVSAVKLVQCSHLCRCTL